AAIAIWATFSLTIRIFTTLKRRYGLYFWALLVASWGISVRSIGILTIYLTPNCPWAIRRMLVETGWVAMTSGFSVVLYSRLSIVLHNHKTRRAVLAMIITNAVIWHPIIITTNAGLPAWQRVHDPVEKTQIVIFMVQEMVISFFYVRAAYRYLHSGFAKKDKAQNAMRLLTVVQIVVIAVDLVLIVIDLSGWTKLKTFIHSVVYTVKMELEFITLNQLVGLSKLGM
ncbi:hypothetical protein EK21DRAFT_44425, partial [Setomelanomma holmii]